MRIVVSGGTGFLGSALVRSLARDSHDITVLSRRGGAPAGARQGVAWTPDGATGPWAAAIDGADAVVNLAGESIAGRRWSSSHKQRILDSRIDATRSLVGAIHSAAVPPSVLVSGSAVGYYGPRDDQFLTESAGAGSDFLASVCIAWEREALRASSSRTRVVLIRTGLVLDKTAGALPQMLPPFQFGVGGRLGSGRQFWPWIHRDDWVSLVKWSVLTPGMAGAANATAPNPVTNADFTRALGRALHRPASLPAPAFALKLLLGEMADALLLSGQRAIPEKALREGFRFEYERVDDALGAIFSA